MPRDSWLLWKIDPTNYYGIITKMNWMMLLMKLLVIVGWITTSKSFEYKTELIERTPTNNNTLDTEVAVPLKYLSNFWRSLDLPLINYEIELHLSLSRNCVISKILNNTEVAANLIDNPPLAHLAEGFTTGATLQINSIKLYVPVLLGPE